MFHSGELAVQERAGVQDMAARVGKGIHQEIPPAARDFLPTQTLAVAGWAVPDGAAPAGQVWASLLAVRPGALSTPDPRTVAVAALPAPGDLLRQQLQPGLALGLLVIDLATRRRMRVNGQVADCGTAGFTLAAHEVYANCPKYIQAREIEPLAPNAAAEQTGIAQPATQLDAAASALISAADTCFIASVKPGGNADASHRGGNPGFVRVVDAQTLLIPDYAGNMMFNTLGNLAVHPQIGLLFVDWTSGVTLQLSGTATILWDDPLIGEFRGAERLVRVQIDAVRPGQAALTSQFLNPSPFNP